MPRSSSTNSSILQSDPIVESCFAATQRAHRAHQTPATPPGNTCTLNTSQHQFSHTSASGFLIERRCGFPTLAAFSAPQGPCGNMESDISAFWYVSVALIKMLAARCVVCSLNHQKPSFSICRPDLRRGSPGSGLGAHLIAAPIQLSESASNLLSQWWTIATPDGNVVNAVSVPQPVDETCGCLHGNCFNCLRSSALYQLNLCRFSYLDPFRSMRRCTPLRMSHPLPQIPHRLRAQRQLRVRVPNSAWSMYQQARGALMLGLGLPLAQALPRHSSRGCPSL